MHLLTDVLYTTFMEISHLALALGWQHTQIIVLFSRCCSGLARWSDTAWAPSNSVRDNETLLGSSEVLTGFWRLHAEAVGLYWALLPLLGAGSAGAGTCLQGDQNVMIMWRCEGWQLLNTICYSRGCPCRYALTPSGGIFFVKSWLIWKCLLCSYSRH